MKYIGGFIILFIALSSCKKDWLEIKPDKSLVVPATIADFQALIDDYGTLNYAQPTLAEIGADNYYIADSRLQTLTILPRNIYLWAYNGYGESLPVGSWSNNYSAIFTANKVIEGITKISRSNNVADAWNNVYGSALFFRAFNYYNLAQLFSKPYIQNTADTDQGLPLRLEANIAQPVQRSTVQDVYDLIIRDLTKAKDLLPVSPLYPYRPSKTAVFGLLARTYLVMGDYDQALLYSDSCLQLKNTLIDFNSLNTTAALSLPSYEQNSEIIIYARMSSTSSLNQPLVDIDSILDRSYSADDLRKSVFIKTSGIRRVWAGSYTGSTTLHFAGIATSEIYFIRAECYARKGDIDKAIKDLNTVMQKRWKAVAWIPFTASDANDALHKILQERRKELPFRGLRWTDLRRLNSDPAFTTTLTRIYNNNSITLVPGDNKYVWPIPDDEILYSGIEQNPR